jgi:hypothetical protein
MPGTMDSITIIRVVVGVLVIPLFIIPFWRIFSRAGFPGVLAILMLIPLVNLIVLYYVAFSRWNVKLDIER